MAATMGATLRRDIDWRDAFWVASGVPALVLFSIGGIAATVGTPSYVVWIVSVIFGFIQAFTYAEIAGLFPGKVRRRLGLWRHRLGALRQAVRAALGLVQLARLVAGARHRLRHRRRLHPDVPVRRRCRRAHLGDHAPRPRCSEEGLAAARQRDVHRRRRAAPDHLRRAAWRHPANGESANGDRHRCRGAASHHRPRPPADR